MYMLELPSTASSFAASFDERRRNPNGLPHIPSILERTSTAASTLPYIAIHPSSFGSRDVEWCSTYGIPIHSAMTPERNTPISDRRVMHGPNPVTFETSWLVTLATET